MSDDSWHDLMEREKRKAQGGGLAGKVVSLFPAREEGLPGENTDYKAASLPAASGLTHLVVILGRQEFKVGKSPYRFFQYVHLGADAELGFTDDGQVVRLYFTGMNPKLLTLHGRNLVQTCDQLQSHRLRWIRVADRDFTPDEAVDEHGQPLPIIKSVEIAPALMPGRITY